MLLLSNWHLKIASWVFSLYRRHYDLECGSKKICYKLFLKNASFITVTVFPWAFAIRNETPKPIMRSKNLILIFWSNFLKFTKKWSSNGGWNCHTRKSLPCNRKICNHITDTVSPSQNCQTEKLNLIMDLKNLKIKLHGIHQPLHQSLKRHQQLHLLWHKSMLRIRQIQHMQK